MGLTPSSPNWGEINPPSNVVQQTTNKVVFPPTPLLASFSSSSSNASKAEGPDSPNSDSSTDSSNMRKYFKDAEVNTSTSSKSTPAGLNIAPNYPQSPSVAGPSSIHQVSSESEDEVTPKATSTPLPLDGDPLSTQQKERGELKGKKPSYVIIYPEDIKTKIRSKDNITMVVDNADGTETTYSLPYLTPSPTTPATPNFPVVGRIGLSTDSSVQDSFSVDNPTASVQDTGPSITPIHVEEDNEVTSKGPNSPLPLD